MNLAELHDIHLEAAPSFWHLAPGWWVLITTLSLMLIWAVYRHRYRWQKWRMKQVAMKELKRYQRYRLTQSPEEILPVVAMLLKRVALVFFERKQIAGLYGEPWLQFLDRTGHTQDFTQGSGQVLATAPYQPIKEADLAKVIEISQAWVRGRH